MNMAKPAAKHLDIKDMSFEKALKELESIVGRLERGDVELEESINIYERGEALRAHCDRLLKLAEARVDRRTDVAVLKIDAKDLPVVRIGSPAGLKAGEWVIAIGSPFGFDNSVTAGIVSATARSLPNIVVDGPPLPSTLLTLSHWPNNQSPATLRRDTSTATAFAYLDATDLHQDVPWVTNNHFDEDGLFSMYAVVEPDRALEDRALLTAGSFAGDFGVVTSRDAARLCFAIEALSDPDVSSLPAEIFAEPDRVAALYTALLESLPPLLRDCHDGWPRYGDLWALQDEHLTTSRALLADGIVTLVEAPALDLVVVRIPAYLRRRTARRYLKDEPAAVHPFAINSATGCSRILRVQGHHYEFEYRYEVSDGRRTATGLGTSTIGLISRDGNFIIVKEAGGVVRRGG